MFTPRRHAWAAILIALAGCQGQSSPARNPPAPEKPRPAAAPPVSSGTPQTVAKPPAPEAPPKIAETPLPKPVPVDPAFKPLNKEETVFLDAEGKRILLKAKVVLDRGSLELLCCRKQTKEHEAILAVDTKAYVIHAGLLAIGAVQGRPVIYQPEYSPPAGQRIDVFLQWHDAEGKLKRQPAQEWIRRARKTYLVVKLPALPEKVTIPDDSKMRYIAEDQELVWFGPMTPAERDEWLAKSDQAEYQKSIREMFAQSEEEAQVKTMEAEWVFAGSSVFQDEETGRNFYRAEDGDVICVANFGSALLDVTARSGSDNADLLFEANTEQLPPVGSDVLIELLPAFDKAGAPILLNMKAATAPPVAPEAPVEKSE